ncbi:MAG: hypothetical protein GTO13_06865 [Proteobacteria bacterium]|nr:hypothetical protein [Pseudomonadota bacterium]
MEKLLRGYSYGYRVAILGVNCIPQRSLRDHKKMLSAMKKRESALVERLVKEHILWGKEIVLGEFQKGTVRPTDMVRGSPRGG